MPGFSMASACDCEGVNTMRGRASKGQEKEHGSKVKGEAHPQQEALRRNSVYSWVKDLLLPTGRSNASKAITSDCAVQCSTLSLRVVRTSPPSRLDRPSDHRGNPAPVLTAMSLAGVIHRALGSSLPRTVLARS